MSCSTEIPLWMSALVISAIVPLVAQTPPAPGASASIRQKAATFDGDIQPIFQANCTGCHGADTRIEEMNLSSMDGALKGSESGPVIAPGKPAVAGLGVWIDTFGM